jgi:GDP-D-mannose dehydratase
LSSFASPEKLRDATGWTPTLNFMEIVEKMVEHDLALLHTTSK